MRGENRSTRGNPSQSRVENQQTQPMHEAECGNRTRATLMGGKCSHHCATTALYKEELEERCFSSTCPTMFSPKM